MTIPDRNGAEKESADPTGLAVNLRVENSRCLVVGGGPVACRKVLGLKTAGAAVVVVSPALCPDLAALAATGQILHVARRFVPADTDGMRIVFAATDDHEVNHRVLEAARTAGALCCCVDGNWTAGDFTTPAALRMDGLTVTVSSGGRSCRQARMVKDTLRRHLRSIETAELLVLGASHEELSLEKRETIQLTGERLQQTGDMLMQVWGVHEFMLLNTCNRVELVAVVSDSNARCEVLERILGLDRLGRNEWYRLTGISAFEHMALVTAGMRSQSPGEYHVASQVKQALQSAVGNGWANGMLQAWIDEALHISKHVKNEILPLLPATEIEDASFDYITQHQGNRWRDRTVMVMGTGMLGRGLVERTVERKARCLWCYHVNPPTPDPAWGDRVRILARDMFKRYLGRCNIVCCAMETSGYVLDKPHASCFSRKQPLTIVDLGLPRNVNPALVELLPRGSELINLDRLKSWTLQRNGDLQRILAMSRDVVQQHRDGYDALITRFQGRNKSQ